LSLPCSFFLPSLCFLFPSFLIGELSFLCLSTAPEDGIFLLCESLQDELSPLQIDMSILSQVPAHDGNVIAPDCNQSIYTILTDV
jgi:hypothetical protein